MRRPTDEELKMALSAADRMWTKNVDPHQLARSVLFLNERNKELEALLQRVNRFLKFGMPEQELGRLRRQVEKLTEEELMDASDADSSMLV